MIKLFLFRFAGLMLMLGVVPAFCQPQPDLIVDQAALRQHWIVRIEDFTATQCDAVEGGISAGSHPIMRFTVATPNIGDADLVIGGSGANSGR